MNLSDLIHKRRPDRVATATVATVATTPPENRPCVAKVATVAVANSEKPEHPPLLTEDEFRILLSLQAIYDVADADMPELLALCAGNPETKAAYLHMATEEYQQESGYRLEAGKARFVAVNRWLGAIRAHKAEIAEALKTETPDANQWRIEYSDGRTLRVGCSPRASLAQVQAEYPDGWVSNVGGPC